MLELLRTVSGRYFQLHGLRTMLVIASIALGVATLVATRALNQSMVETARGAATPLRGASDLLVSNGDQGVPRELVKELRDAKIPGVKATIPLIFGRLIIPQLKDQNVVLVGVERDEETLRQLRELYGLRVPFLWEARPPKGAYLVFLGSRLASALGSDIGKFDVRAEGSQVHTMSCVGTVEAEGSAASLAGNVIVVDLSDAEKILGWDKRTYRCVTRVDILLDQGGDREVVRRELNSLLGGRADVRTPEFNDQTVRKVMAGLELGFQLCGLCALGVGFLLVFMVLSVSVAERRHDIGIMRSLGATRRQIIKLFMGEAALLGVVGSFLGIPLGLGLAYLFLGPFKRILGDVFVRNDERQLAVEPETVVLALILGVVVSMIAALGPAYRAAAEEPADAVRRVPIRATIAGWFGPSLVSLVLVLIGMGFFLVRGQLSEPRYGTYGAIFFTFLGAVAASIPLASLATHLLRPIVRYFFGVEERLAADNLTRSPLRAGLVIAILAAFVALMMQTSGVILSSKEEILNWVDRSIAAPLLVSSNSPITASSQNMAMQKRVGDNIAKLPDVSLCVGVRYRQVPFRSEQVFLIALDPEFALSREMLTDPVPGMELVPKLSEPGTALVSENFAILHHVKVGDTIKVSGRRGEVELRVIGTALDYSWNRGTIIMNSAHYAEAFDDPLVDVFNVYLRTNNDQVRDEVSNTIMRNWGAEEALVVITRGQLRDNIADMIKSLYSIGYVQEAVVGLVAAMGVVTALLISVLQRRRELGLLRAVGASRGQILRTVLAEALLMGLIGAVLGLAIGVPMEWYAVRVILFEEAGFTFAMIIPWLAVGVVTVLALATAIIAGLLPALHAVRLHIAEAIAYE